MVNLKRISHKVVGKDQDVKVPAATAIVLERQSQVGIARRHSIPTTNYQTISNSKLKIEMRKEVCVVSNTGQVSYVLQQVRPLSASDTLKTWRLASATEVFCTFL